MANEENSNAGLTALIVILVGVIIIGAFYFLKPQPSGNDENNDDVNILPNTENENTYR